MKLFNSIIFIALLTLNSFLLLGCEDEEKNSIAKAQACLDRARTSAEAGNCRQLIEGKTSQQAYIVRCSIEFVAGGLTTQKIADAFKGQEEATVKKEAKLMALLSLGDATTAQNASYFCNLSEVPGLQYLANLSLIGTLMTSGISTADPSTFLSTCQTLGCSNEAVGNAVINLAESSCKGGEENNDVCGEVNAAIAASGGNPEAVAAKFYELLNNQ